MVNTKANPSDNIKKHMVNVKANPSDNITYNTVCQDHSVKVTDNMTHLIRSNIQITYVQWVTLKYGRLPSVV